MEVGEDGIPNICIIAYVLDFHVETVSDGEVIVSLPKYQDTKLLDEACAVIEEMGGVGALIEDLAEFHDLHVHMNRQRPSLVEKYPDKWVAVGMNGVLAVGDSEEKVFQDLERQGICGSDILIEFMDSDPPTLIL